MIFKKNLFFISILLIVFLLIGIIIIPKAKKKEAVKEKKIIAKVAIVIDDLGYNLNNLDLIYSIKKPLTLSILPGRPYSKRIAIEAAAEGYEIILHLPLEPHDKDAPMEPNTIYVNMAEVSVRQKLKNAFYSVPTLKGLSNHMGSRATEVKAPMRIIFKELKRKKLYFLDSLATDKSVCEDLAGGVGIKFAERDVYLDNISEASYIKNQFKLLIEQAKKRGSSIGIGHDRNLTIKTLAEEMPRLAKEGIEFVFVSELVK